MLAIERRNEILTKLQEDKRVVVSDLSQIYHVTEETIRRDLEKLEKEGLAKKTYGGAVLNDSFYTDLPYTVRKKANVLSKQQIAERIVSRIGDGAHIMLDASSTALFVAKQLKDRKNLTIITNSIEILLEISDRSGWNILCTGGMLKEGGLALVGYQAERMFSSFHVDYAIFSSKGIDIESGIMDSNENDAQMKRLMSKAAKERILVVDYTKFERVSFVKVCEWTDIDLLVTDKEPEERWKRALEAFQVELIYE